MSFPHSRGWTTDRGNDRTASAASVKTVPTSESCGGNAADTAADIAAGGSSVIVRKLNKEIE